jgi:N-formylglutamate deformylase
MSQPMTKKLHEKLIKDYYLPFHQQIEQQFKNLKQKFSEVYQLDLHSMPSVGTAFHQDPGKERPEVVVSDFKGKCSDLSFVELVINSYKKAGFQVNYNDPYIGGGITQKYGHPSRHQHCVQVELKRNLYMNEDTKEKNQLYENTKKRLAQAIKEIYLGIKEDEIF